MQGRPNYTIRHPQYHPHPSHLPLRIKNKSRQPITNRRPMPNNPFQQPKLTTLLRHRPTRPPTPLPRQQRLTIRQDPINTIRPTTKVPPRHLPKANRANRTRPKQSLQQIKIRQINPQQSQPTRKWNLSNIINLKVPTHIPQPTTKLVTKVKRLLKAIPRAPIQPHIRPKQVKRTRGDTHHYHGSELR